MENKYNKILNEIATEIVESKNREFENYGYGLMAGLTGETIFLNEFSKINNSYKTQTSEFIDLTFKAIEEGTAFPYHCAGISGACLGLNYLLKENEGEDGFEFAEGEISDYIDYEFENSLNSRNLDFLHGAVGLGFYYLERINQGEHQFIQSLDLLLKNLVENSIEEDDKIKWLQRPTQDTINISLSHGMSSIIILLSELLLSNIEFSIDIKNLLQKSTNYVLAQEINLKEHGSLFPYASKEAENLKGSRLAWCYGDLGVGLAFLKASSALNDIRLQDKALEIFEKATLRRDLQKDLVLDAGICHGSAGIALIFHDIFLKTQNPIFEEATSFWLNKTIDLYDEGKIFYLPNVGYDDKQMSVLEGKAGIGLTILSIHHNTPSLWKKFFLI